MLAKSRTQPSKPGLAGRRQGFSVQTVHRAQHVQASGRHHVLKIGLQQAPVTGMPQVAVPNTLRKRSLNAPRLRYSARPPSELNNARAC